ncbi:MAG: potassium-transporting ATPase subunit KdpC [Hyphomonadaceae bacterium]|nr:MAG: K+-transporting ATPase ATPase C chain [Caulobacteraceae bacterium]MBT9445783.1 potassium-transporting ATPase subunit KdpC [Hyphomonadaceae bacterium]
MMQHFRAAAVLLGLFTLLVGVGYPLAMTGFGQVVFPHQANGSLITREGQVVGSGLIGQAFSRPDYFWGRPSAAGKGYDGRSSSGSNLGPSSRALAERIQADAARYGGDPSQIPSDLLTASGSGLDPDISPAAARFQVPRVAAARHLDEAKVALLVERAIVAPPLGVLGDARVNVLELNLALDTLAPASSTATPVD